MKRPSEKISKEKTQIKPENKINQKDSKPEPSIKKTELKQQIPNDNDDSGDDEIINIKKIQKNSIPNLDFNKTVTKMNIEQSNNYSLNLLKQRGFDLEEQEMKLFLNEINDKTSKKSEATQIFSGQADANLKTLETELKKALDKNNKHLACSILNTILSKDINREKSIYYRFQVIDILMELKSTKDCLTQCQKLLNSDLDMKDQPKIYYLSSKLKLEISDIWDGYFDLLKAKSSLMIDCDNSKNNREKLENEIEELSMIYEMKISKKERNTLDFLYLTGSSKIGVLGVKEQGLDKIFTFTELKNRMICSISCEDHYSLIVVKSCACIQNNFDFTNCLGNFSDKCNKETQVFGWGQNTVGQIDPSLKSSFIEKPYLIPFFIGKNICKISTYKSVSLAYDMNGNIYEWGSNIEGVKFCLKLDKKISDILKGPSFSLILTSDGELLLMGQFLLNNEVIIDNLKPTTLSKTNKFIQVSIGLNHILAVNEKRELFGLGSNVCGQLCFDENFKETTEFVKLEQCKIMQIKKSFCLNNCSFILTMEGELYYFGQISAKKNVRYPAQTEFPEEVKIRDVNGNGSEIFVITEKGEVLYWNTETSAVFKQYINTRNESFKEIFVGKHYQLLLKPLIVPEECFFIEENQEYETFKKINLKLQIRDHNDICSATPFYSLRYFFCLSNSPNEDVNNMKNLCKDLVNNNRNKYNNATMLLYEEILYHRLKNLKVSQNLKVLHQYNLEFFVEKSGEYYLYLFINEKLIKNCPFALQIGKSPVEEVNLLKIQEDNEKEEKKAQEILEKQKEIEAKKMEEQLLQEKKQENTEKRAEETLKKHIQEKNETAAKEESIKKMKADLITGGGFDLEKSKKLKSTQFNEKKLVSNQKQIPQKSLTKLKK